MTEWVGPWALCEVTVKRGAVRVDRTVNRTTSPPGIRVLILLFIPSFIYSSDNTIMFAMILPCVWKMIGYKYDP
jgi:hypothetical protein